MSEPPDYYEAAQLLSKSPQVIFVSSAPPEQEGSAGEERSSDSNQTPWWKKILWKAGNKRQIPLGEAPNVTQSLLAIAKLSLSNVLLIFVPLSWTFYFAELSDGVQFIFSIFAIIPLAKLGSFATDELSMRFGPVVVCLLDVTFSHNVELIIVISALVHCHMDVVQTTLIGAILSHLLLLLGMIFFTGGICSKEQRINKSVAQVDTSLLALSVIAVLLPVAFDMALPATGGTNSAKMKDDDTLSISYGVAIILLFVYSCYLIFQLVSHRILFEPGNSIIQKKVQEIGVYSPALARKLHIHRQRTLLVSSSLHPDNDATNRNEYRGSVCSLEAGPVKDKGFTAPYHMNLPITIGLFLFVIVAVAITVGALFDSIDDTTQRNPTFFNLIILPNLANAAEYWDVIDLVGPVEDTTEDTIEEKMTEFFGNAMGSSIQIALFIIPFTVILGWILGKPLTLMFDPYESLVLFFAVLVVSYVTQGGKSNWLKGMILICLYVIVAVTLWYYPGSNPSSCT